VCLTVAAGSISQAAIIGVDCQTQGQGVALNSWDWDEVPYDLTLNETLSGTAGTVLAGFATDDYVDPIVWVRKSVENDTTFAWTDYHINLFLDRTFDILNVATPAGWTYAITAPAFSGQRYFGCVDYYGAGQGTEISVGQFGDFAIKFSFLGAVQFYVEQVRTPEPASMILLLAASGCLLQRRSGKTK
jgi:hypothetical protein